MSPHQRYQYQVVPRSQIKGAPYNPRTIAPQAKKKLQKKLASVGLVEPLVWNARTGHLVSGHQRLELLDALEGSTEYEVGVAVVDLDDQTEIAQNIFFNNLYAQGGFDPDLFADLLKHESGPTLDGMGFSTADVEVEFGPEPTIDPAFQEMADAQAPLVEGAQAVANSSKRWNDLAKETAEINTEAGITDSDYVMALIFSTRDEYDAFLATAPLADGVVSADVLLEMLDEVYRWR